MGFTRQLAALCVVGAFPLAALAALPDEMKALIEQGKPGEAYDLGEQHSEQLGDPAFDFFYGVAAVDSGHAGDGVLSLERYLINYPDNFNARLELARGYFILGEDPRAREEFETVLKGNPPADVQANIQRFLDALRSRESRYKTSSAAFLEAGYGYDSNVNAGVNNAALNLPIFGAVTVPTSGVKARDNFEYFALGGQVSQPIAPGVSVFGAGQFNTKFNRTHTEFDQNDLNLNSGVTFLKNKNLFRGSASYNRVTLHNQRFRSGPGVAAEWDYQRDELQSFSLVGQYADLNYGAANTVRNSDYYTVSEGWRKAFIAAWQPLLAITVTVGREDNHKGFDNLSRKISAAQASFGITPFPKWAINLEGDIQRSNYRGPEITGQIRHDNYYAALLNISYAITRSISARAELLYSRNNSNVSLFSYQRNLATLKLRYDFR
jgi:hypothetical protein